MLERNLGFVGWGDKCLDPRIIRRVSKGRDWQFAKKSLIFKHAVCVNGCGRYAI